ncbi:MAG: hypothetical protein KGJ79_08730 [Alphaproteobacteria bacterium]|nr:hypothetical protein [Alphaproteobacteria bacterium]MDE2496033.1 hypothetical protein [Alphaproteobacteria bacterium]
MHVVKQIIHAVALFLIIGWKFLADPHGTTDQAVVLVRTHFADVRRIAAIVEKDRTLRWVTPGSDAEGMTSENGPPTAGTKADYDAINGILARWRFRDLDIVRDEKPPHDLRFMRFVVFDVGYNGDPPGVEAEWAAPGQPLDARDPKSCKPIQSGWVACPFAG